MKLFLTITISFFIIFGILSQSKAFTFTDDFNRSNSSTIGNNWNVYHGGTSGISSNQLFLDNGTSESIGNNSAYYNLGVTLDYAIVYGKFRFDIDVVTTDSSTFYIGLNATVADIERNNTGWGTHGKGYGIAYSGSYSKNYPFFSIIDSTGSTGSPLKWGAGNLTNNQDYNFELIYDNGSLDARFWEYGTDRPEAATFSYAPGTMPQYSGTNLVFNIGDEGNLYLDYVTVTNVPIPEPGTLILLAISFCSLTWLKKYKWGIK